MSFLRYFKVALNTGVPRWVLARAISFQEFPEITIPRGMPVIINAR